MDKTLRNTLIIGILIIALSIGYYFVIFLPRSNDQVKANKQSEEQIKGIRNELKVGDEFFLKNGRKLKIKEVSVGSFYVEIGGHIRTDLPMRGQISVRIESDGGPLNEEEYNAMYITQGTQLIKLSNSGGAYWGQYWFDLPKTDNYDGMELHFGDESVVRLIPYIKNNTL